MKDFWEEYEIPLFYLAAAILAAIIYGVLHLASSIHIKAEIVEVAEETQAVTDTITVHNRTTKALTVQTVENTTEPVIELTEPVQCEYLPLPDIDTSVKTFTDYRCYNIVGTPHKRLQQVCYTDSNGFRRFGEDYVVALGSYYSIDIGDRYRVTLDTGVEFTVILGDCKADCDTDVSNMYAPCVNYDGENVGNLLEFIIDADVLPDEVYNYGDLQRFEFMQGSIVQFEYIGRDDSDDWNTYELGSEKK